LKKKSKESKFSIDNDASFYTSRGMGEIPAEAYRCDVPAKILGNTMEESGEQCSVVFA
jgi:hypothetical protein